MPWDSWSSLLKRDAQTAIREPHGRGDVPMGEELDPRPGLHAQQNGEKLAAATPAAAVGDEELEIKLMFGGGVHIDLVLHDHLQGSELDPRVILSGWSSVTNCRCSTSKGDLLRSCPLPRIY